MQQNKKSVRFAKWKIILLSSLATGCTLLPTILFSALAGQQSGNVDFLLPTIVVYTVQRVCLIALRGFGEITNPRKILKVGILSALAGAAFVLASVVYRPLLLIGALLVGIGLSPVASMYAPLRLEMAEKGYPVAGTDTPGTVVALAFMLMILFTRKCAFPLIQTAFLLYMGLALYSLLSLNTEDFFQSCPAFDTEKRKPAYFLFAALVLVFLAVVRQYKTSGIPALIYMAPVAVTIGVVMEICRRRNYPLCVWQIYWTGGLGTFLLIFGLIYQAAAGVSSGSMLCYAVLLVAKVSAMFIAKPVQKCLRGKSLAWPCIFLSAGLAFLLLVPVPAVFYAAILFSALFANLAEAEAGRVFMLTERHPMKERALARNRVSSIGKCLVQMVLFLSILLVEKFRTHASLLTNAADLPASEATAAMRTVCLVCCCALLVCAILVFILKKTKKGAETNEQERNA